MAKGMTVSGNNFVPAGLGSFFGGQSVDKKLGTQAQFYDDLHIDFRSQPSNFTVLPGTRENTSSQMTGLILAMDKINNGDIYAIDNKGKVWKKSSGTWTSPGTIGSTAGDGTAGLIYRADLDNLYMAGTSKLARIFHVTGAATFQSTFFTKGISNSSTCFKTGGGITYSLPTVLSEAAADTRKFTSDISPLIQIGIFVVAKGTGNWKLTLHDDANNVLGTVTILNASLTNGVINYFVFSAPIAIIRGDKGAGSALTYHYHMTSTVNDGTLQTTTDLSDCDMELWANALFVTNNGLHPMTNFLDMTLIGNGQFVASYEPLQDSPTTSDYNRHRLTLPPGFEVLGFAQRNLTVVVAASNRGTGVGVLFFWDGISDTYQDWWTIQEGEPETIFSNQNTVYFIANGALYQVQSTDQPIKIRTLRQTNTPYSGSNNTTHVYPYCMTAYHGILHMAYPSTTTSLTLPYGVFTYGVISREYPLSLGFSYTVSTGSTLNSGSNNLTIGMIRAYGDELYISWRDDSNSPAYGLDIVDNTSSPAPTYKLELLTFDDKRPFAYKNVGDFIATFDAWPSGATLILGYQLDDDGAATEVDVTPATGALFAILPIDRKFLNGRFYARGAVGSTTPNFSSLNPFIDGTDAERPVGG